MVNRQARQFCRAYFGSFAALRSSSAADDFWRRVRLCITAADFFTIAFRAHRP